MVPCALRRFPVHEYAWTFQGRIYNGRSYNRRLSYVLEPEVFVPSNLSGTRYTLGTNDESDSGVGRYSHSGVGWPSAPQRIRLHWPAMFRPVDQKVRN